MSRGVWFVCTIFKSGKAEGGAVQGEESRPTLFSLTEEGRVKGKQSKPMNDRKKENLQ